MRRFKDLAKRVATIFLVIAIICTSTSFEQLSVVAADAEQTQIISEDGNISDGIVSNEAVSDEKVNNQTVSEETLSSEVTTMHKVTFLGFEGVELGVVEVGEGQTVVSPEAPVIEGYTFKGWDTDFSAVTDDMTVNAVYEDQFPIFDKSVTVLNGTTITAYAERGIVPEGATLLAEVVELEDTQKDAIDNKLGVESSTKFAFDIKVVTKEGNTIDPAGNESIKISFSNLPMENDEQNLQQENVEVVHILGSNVEEQETNVNNEIVSFEAEHFSVYVITITEDDVLFEEQVVPATITLKVGETKQLLGLRDIKITDDNNKSTRGFWAWEYDHSIVNEALTITRIDSDKFLNTNYLEITGKKVTSTPIKFTYWYNDPKNNRTRSDVVYVNVVEDKCTLTYNTNGAETFNGNAITSEQSLKVNKNDSITLPSVTKSGYAFLGWYKDNNKSYETKDRVGGAGEKYTVKQTSTLFAGWIKNKTVTFDANGGSGADYSMRSDDNASIIFPSIEATGLSRSGYQFVGWSTQANGRGSNYLPGNQLQGITSDITLYAIWLKSDSSKEIAATYYVRLDGKMPYEPSGYDSSSYSAGVSGTIRQGVAINNNTEMVKSNLSDTPSVEKLNKVLKAHGKSYDPNNQEIIWYVIKYDGDWHVDGVIRDKSKVTVTYNANGGSVDVMPAQPEYVVGAVVNVDFANNPSKTGYQFLGWSTDKNATLPTYTSTGTKTFVMGSSNVTLYAIWQANGNTQYKVSVYLGNGDGTYSKSAADSYIANAKTDLTVTAVAKDIEGYEFNSSAVGSVLSTTVKADGTGELVLYYDYVKKTEVTITANSQKFVYDGTKHSVGTGDYTVTGLPSGYTVSGISVSTAGVTNVSENSVATSISIDGKLVIKDAGGKDVTSKFQITSVPGSISVTPAEITVVASNATKTYGESDPSFAYKIAEDKQVVPGNTLTVNCTRVLGENVRSGGYAITPQVTCNTSNYTISVTSGTLTINPLAVVVKPDPIEKVYKKADPTLTYTPPVEIKNTMAPLNVTLDREDGEALGTYPITVTPGSNPNYIVTTGTANFTIKQGEATVTIKPANKMYGEKDPVFEYSISGNDYTAADLNLTFSRDTGETVNKDGYKVTATGNSNIKITVVPGTLTITKRPITVSVNSVSKVFGDTDPSYTYSVTEGSIAAIDLIGGITDTNKFKVTVDRAAGSDVKEGGYALTPAMSGSSIANYDVKIEAGTLTINPMPVTISVDGASKTFGEADPTTYSYTVVDKNNNPIDGVSANVTRESGEDAGTYAINASIASPNYDETVTKGVFTIQPKAITVSANSVSKTYGDTDPTFKSSVTDVNGNVVSVGSEVTISLTRENVTAKNVGTYAIKVEATCATNSKGKKNYTITPVDGTLTINPFEVTVTAGNGSKSFGEADEALDYSLTKTLPYGDVLDVKVDRVKGEAVGNYATTATVTTNNNYKVTTAPGTFTITKKNIQVVINNASKEYGNSDPVYTFTIDGIKKSAEEIGLIFERISGENVGEYEVTAKLDPNNAYYNLVSVTPGKLTIMTRPVIVTAIDTAKVYGAVDPVFNYTISGNGIADRDKNHKDQFDVTIPKPSTSNAGTYTITPNVIGTNASNYAVSFVSGNYEITRKALIVKAVDTKVVYGDTNYNFSSKITGLVNGDGADAVSVSYNCAANATSNVGTYDITPAATSKNYEIIPQTGTLTIAQKPVTVTVDPVSKTYGDSDPEFTANADVAGVKVTFTREAGENKGTYTITPVIEDTNYVIDGKPTGTLTINPRDITLTMGTYEKTYGESNPEFKYTLSENLISGNELKVTVKDLPGENVKYDTDGNVIAYVLEPVLNSDSSKNYNVSLVNGSLKVNPFEVKVSADDKMVTYGDSEESLTVSMSPKVLPNNESLVISLQRTNGMDAGDYVITPSVKTNGNYKVTVKNGTYKINPKAITVKASDSKATYGAATYEFGYTVSPVLVGSDTIQVSYNTTAIKNSNVGDYEITPVVKENNNYVFTPVTGTLTIGKKSIALTVDNASKVYGDKDPQFTYTTSESIISGNTISVNMVRVAGEDVNADGYPITATVAETQNYAIETVPGVFTITQRPVKITVPSVAKTYGENDPVFKYSVSDLGSTKMEGFSVPVVLSRVSGENVGTYALLAKVNNNNFKATYELGNLEIGKKTVEVSVNDASKFVGEKDPVFTYSVDGLVGSDTLNISVVRYVGEAVGTYSIVAYVGSTNNYNVMTDYGTLTINALTTLADGTVPLSPSLIGEATQTTNRTPNNTTADQTDENVQIAEDEVPLADAPSVEGTDRQDDDGITVIDDEDTAKAAMLESDCWIHWLILLLTAVYSVFAIVRANQRNKKIREMEEEKETANV